MGDTRDIDKRDLHQKDEGHEFELTPEMHEMFLDALEIIELEDKEDKWDH